MLTVYKVCLALATGLALVFALQAFYTDSIGPFSNAVAPMIAGAALVSAGFAFRKYVAGSGKFRLVWSCFAIGMLLWFLGELGWAVYTFVLGVEVPYPSIADIFWLAGYIPFFVALSAYVRIFASVISKPRLAVVLVVVALVSVCVTSSLVAPMYGSEEELTTLIIDFAYPALDLTLFSMALLGLAVFYGGNIGKSWLLMTTAILCNVTGDFLFSYATMHEAYYSGHVSDLLFLYGYLLFLAAFQAHIKEL